MISYGVFVIGHIVLTHVVYFKSIVAGVSMILPTAPSCPHSTGLTQPPWQTQNIRRCFDCIQMASVSAGSSDCGRQIRIQSGQDDLFDVVNLRPRRDLLPRFAFTIPSYLILREGRE